MCTEQKHTLEITNGNKRVWTKWVNKNRHRHRIAQQLSNDSERFCECTYIVVVVAAVFFNVYLICFSLLIRPMDRWCARIWARARTHIFATTNTFRHMIGQRKGHKRKRFLCHVKSRRVKYRDLNRKVVFIYCVYISGERLKWNSAAFILTRRIQSDKESWIDTHTHTDWMEHKLRCFESVFHLLLTKIRSVWHWTWLYQSITTEDNNIKRRKKKQQIWWIFEVCCVVFFFVY